MGAGGKKTFKQYLRSLGLDYEAKIKTSPEEIRREKEAALRQAKNIVSLDKKRREKNASSQTKK
ncbi:MAG: hypothetical protein ACTSPI_00650 [Candidatus Heimdallarchaeaceae archaeon]